jgi:hypothetical protein
MFYPTASTTIAFRVHYRQMKHLCCMYSKKSVRKIPSEVSVCVEKGRIKVGLKERSAKHSGHSGYS